MLHVHTEPDSSVTVQVCDRGISCP